MSEIVGRYRKLYPRIWRHPGFRGLTKSARELAVYLLTGPQTSPIGLFHLSIATAAEDLDVGVETLRKGLSDIAVTFGWQFDRDARVFYIPSWWRWNTPENGNVLKGNLKALNEIPPCGLVDAFARNIETLPETLRQTFAECCLVRLPKPSPIQDQEQKQKQEQETARARGSAGAARRFPDPGNAKDEEPNESHLKTARSVLTLTNPRAPMAHLVDAFLSVHQGECSKPAAISALNTALLERREVAS